MSETDTTKDGAATGVAGEPVRLDHWVQGMDPALRRSFSMLTVSAASWSVWFYTVNGAALSQYAKSLGVKDWGFGIIAALTSAAAIFQWPGSYIIERTGRRKPLLMIAGLVSRCMWILIAAIPWVWPDKAGWPWLLIGLYGLSQFTAQMLAPAWVVWMSDLVPMRVRGQYFTFRMQFARAMGVPVTLLIGWLMDHAGVLDLTRTLSVMLGVTALFGIGDVLCYKGLPDEPRKASKPPPPIHRLLAEPLRDAGFRRFLAFVFTHNLAMGYVSQYVWRYLFDIVKLNNLWANTMLLALPLLVSMVTAPVWARLVDRLGCRPVLLISGVMIVHGSVAWIFVTPDHWWWGYAMTMLATVAWPGIDLGLQNMLMRISGSADHGRGSSAYVAVYALVVAVGGAVSGLFGSVIAGWLHEWQTEIGGWTVTYHGVLFIISAGLRLASLFWLIGLPEPHAYGTREALRYMAEGLYANVQQAVLMPVRGAGQLTRMTRLTYRLLPGGKRREK